MSMSWASSSTWVATNCRAGTSGRTSRKLSAPAASAAETPPIPTVMPLIDEYALAFVSSNADVPHRKMPGSPDAAAPSSKEPTEVRIASEPSSAASRPQARLALTSAASSQNATSMGRPSAHSRLIEVRAASVPTR